MTGHYWLRYFEGKVICETEGYPRNSLWWFKYQNVSFLRNLEKIDWLNLESSID